MFGKRPGRESTNDIEVFQQAADQVTEASEFIDKKLLELGVEGTHPWHASDAVHLQLAFATMSHIADRTAELLLKEGTKKKRFGGNVASADIVTFARFLSDNAPHQLITARQYDLALGEDGSDVDLNVQIDEESANMLHPAENLPRWPRAYPDGIAALQEDEVQWQYPEQAEVTPAFIAGIIEAGKEFHAHAGTQVRAFATMSKVPVPPELVGLVQVIEEQIIPIAELSLEEATKLILTGEVSDDNKAAAYKNAYDGFMGMALALVASRTPQVLGPEFFPRRESTQG